MYHDKKSYNEIMDMPTDIRLDYLQFINKEITKKNEEQENAKKDIHSSQTNKSSTNPNIK